MSKCGYLQRICLACLLLAGCEKMPDVNNLNDGRIYIIGHAGSGRESIDNWYPPNSFSSVVNAIEYYNADGVEIDIQLTTDSILFMFHDSTLGIASNCTGCISEYDAGLLSSCTFKTNTAQGNEYLAPLEAVISRFSTRSIKPVVFLDLHNDVGCVAQEQGKFVSYGERLTSAITQLISKYNAHDWVYVQSANEEWLDKIKRKNSAVRVFLDGDLEAKRIEYASAAGFDGMASNMSNITAEEIELAHSKNLQVQVHGPIIRSDMVDNAQKNPDYILVDNIPLAQNVLY